ALSAKAFGEGEYWLAAIKVITVVVFLICGVAMIFGILGDSTPGFSNWTDGEAPFVGGWLSIVSVFMIAGFSFQGTELIGVAAGEAENPQRDIPRAIKAIFWRIMLFYIGAIFVIGMLIPYMDPSLLSSEASDITTSPFTLVFERAGVAFAAALMNAVILSAILSAGNSGLYASARMLYSMALDGKAPKIFARLNKRGVPMPAMLLTASVGLFGFLTAIVGQGSAYTWLLNVSGLSGFIAWVGIAVCHYKFRKAYIASGQDLANLPYKAPLFPLGPILAFVILIVVIVGQNYQAIVDGNLLQMASSYIGLPIFLLLWLGHWLATRKQPAVAIDPWTAKLH
ncbi:MAG: amino acid permease, partial [Glutamicibacter sp.]